MCSLACQLLLILNINTVIPSTHKYKLSCQSPSARIFVLLLNDDGNWIVCQSCTFTALLWQMMKNGGKIVTIGISSYIKIQSFVGTRNVCNEKVGF